MARGQKATPDQLIESATAPKLEAPKIAAPKVPDAYFEKRLRKTGFHHIYFYDKSGDGRMIEVALVKAEKAGGRITTIRYIDVNLLDNVDKGRLKTIVTNVHADKYELWDLMSQNTLNNGKNALDYFHQLTIEERGPGSINTAMGGGLSSVRKESGAMIGSEFTDTASGGMEGVEA